MWFMCVQWPLTSCCPGLWMRSGCDPSPSWTCCSAWTRWTSPSRPRRSCRPAWPRFRWTDPRCHPVATLRESLRRQGHWGSQRAPKRLLFHVSWCFQGRRLLFRMFISITRLLEMDSPHIPCAVVFVRREALVNFQGSPLWEPRRGWRRAAASCSSEWRRKIEKEKEAVTHDSWLTSETWTTTPSIPSTSYRQEREREKSFLKATRSSSLHFSSIWWHPLIPVTTAQPFTGAVSEFYCYVFITAGVQISSTSWRCYRWTQFCIQRVTFTFTSRHPHRTRSQLGLQFVQPFSCRKQRWRAESGSTNELSWTFLG